MDSRLRRDMSIQTSPQLQRANLSEVRYIVLLALKQMIRKKTSKYEALESVMCDVIKMRLKRRDAKRSKIK